jgi:uncharacterized protein
MYIKSSIERIRTFFQSIISQEKSPRILALSFCVGNYIAFSPFIGLHTVMAIVFSKCFRLNMALTFAISCSVNNPWTAAPVYALDYIFGYWLVHVVMQLSLQNPSWMRWMENLIESTLQCGKPCLWSFLIGGNVLGIITSLALYPIVKWIFKTLLHTQEKNRIL